MNDKVVVVTGANSGLGLETAKHFSGEGHQVILAVRNTEKGRKAKEDILRLYPQANVQVYQLDLSKLQSVREFVKTLSSQVHVIDLLINNAGVMMPPYSKTEDGFELQFASNHLGHFALTGLLLPLLENGEASRIVTLTSIAYRNAVIQFENLHGSKGYKSYLFYGQSKLANLMFAKELDKRLKANHYKTKSLAAHPGISSTNLFTLGRKETPWFVKPLLKVVSQPAEKGALPIIMAATDQSLQGGELIGPDGKGGRKGNPTIEEPKKVTYTDSTMEELWTISEDLTEVKYHFNK
ncbi:oxidoreductase [Alkalicoccobacillus plakortidis]|uniref:Oxidoreductase n=1 Tax=Alkalicoccobacillus plakortidis TaxID=444060 RepID=A0ABT0XQD3_9BACI|nr:oxidoreductase [Alkalicoccobacillus plakortidis]MCM2677925.1 oxidoreductase [Alkalicoccobacillus plakortidis]